MVPADAVTDSPVSPIVTDGASVPAAAVDASPLSATDDPCVSVPALAVAASPANARELDPGTYGRYDWRLVEVGA